MVNFRNLNIDPSAPVEEWGFEGLLAALERGDIRDWHRIAEAVMQSPRGKVAAELEEVIEVVEDPAMSSLFSRILRRAVSQTKNDDRTSVLNSAHQHPERESNMAVKHPILTEGGFDQAVDYVQSYFHDQGKSGRKYYTGAYFDTWAGGGDGSTANELTGDDFVAVSMLSVFVPAEAAAGLQEKASEIRELLAALPVGLDFTDLNRSGFEGHLGPGSAAQKLWDVLRSHSDPWGIGPTTASKIMARKRPALIPIYDSEVGPQMGLQNSALQWEKWFQAFQDDPGLGERLDRIGVAAGVPNISRLRIMDVALWRYAKDGHPAPAS